MPAGGPRGVVEAADRSGLAEIPAQSLLPQSSHERRGGGAERPGLVSNSTETQGSLRDGTLCAL